MQPQRKVILLTGFAVLVGGYVLLPREEEHMTMLARDGLYETALKGVGELTANARRRPNILMQLEVLRERVGDLPGALSALQSYLELRPDDIAARETLADLWLQMGNTQDYVAAIASIVQSKPSKKRIELLLSLYRLHNRFEDEKALLLRFAGNPLLNANHYERLGGMLAVSGDRKEAERWLTLADQTATAGASAGRLMLFGLLLDNGRDAIALERAKVWLKSWRNPYLTGKLLTRMAQVNSAQVNDLANFCVDLMPQATFDLAGVLARKGYPSVARTLLGRWSSRVSDPTTRQLRDLVYAAGLSGDERAPLLMLARMLRGGAPIEHQAALAQEIAFAYGIAKLAPLRPMLSADVLRARPLFAAQLMSAEGNAMAASMLLEQTDLERLDTDDRQRWLDVLYQSQSRSGALQTLMRMQQQRRLPRDMQHVLVTYARQVVPSDQRSANVASLQR